MNEHKLPPMPLTPDVLDPMHNPQNYVHPVLRRAQPFLSSPERIERYKKMIEIFTLLDEMDSQRRDHADWTPQSAPDISGSPLPPPSRSSRSSSPVASSRHHTNPSAVLYPAPDQRHLDGYESQNLPPSEPFVSQILLHSHDGQQRNARSSSADKGFNSGSDSLVHDAPGLSTSASSSQSIRPPKASRVGTWMKARFLR